MYTKTFTLSTALGLITSASFAEDHSHHAHHNHAAHNTPAGIMKAHTHPEGEFMLSYTAKRMTMHGMMNGDSKVSNADVRTDGGYNMAPTDMTMDMHMFGGMYGLNDDQTLAVMGQYMFNSMRIKTAMTTFKTHAEGFGDTQISIIDDLDRYGFENLIVSYGLSLPTGNIGLTDNTPMGVNQKLPYNMQMGSGTYDVHLTATYQDALNDTHNYGVQGRTVLRTGINDEGYRLGNRYEATAWLSKELNPELTVTGLTDISYREETHRADGDLNPMMTPTADSEQTEGTVMNFGAIVDYDLGHNYTIGARFEMPVYQNYSGYQMARENTLLLQLRKTF